MKRTDIKINEEYLVTKAGRSPRGNRVDFKGVAVSATKEDTYTPDVNTYPLPEWRGVRIRVTEVTANPDVGGTSWRSSLPPEKRKPNDKHSIQGMAHAIELEVGEEVVVPAMQILGRQIDLDHEKALRINKRRDEEATRARIKQSRKDRKAANLKRAEELGLRDVLYSESGYENSFSIEQIMDLIESDRKNR